jgi:hypothetical protein
MVGLALPRRPLLNFPLSSEGELRRRNWTEAELAKRRKGAAGKVQITGQWRQNTMTT